METQVWKFLEDLSFDGSEIKKNPCKEVWFGFIWLKRGSGSGFLWAR